MLESVDRELILCDRLGLNAQASMVVLRTAFIDVGHPIGLPSRVTPTWLGLGLGLGIRVSVRVSVRVWRRVTPTRAAVVLRIPEGELVLDVLAHRGDHVPLVRVRLRLRLRLRGMG